jgi:hypothetical protein
MRLRHVLLTLITAVCCVSGSLAAAPLTGKSARFIVAGRVQAVVDAYRSGASTCDVSHFDLSELDRLTGLLSLSNHREKAIEFDRASFGGFGTAG